MEILASRSLLSLSPKPSPIRNPNFPLFLSPPKPKPKPKSIQFSCDISHSSSPISPNFNGWDDLDLLEPPKTSTFPLSLGLDESKLAVSFFLGLLSALAVSRVRFSFVVIFPLSILVFVVGFSAGSARVRAFDEKVDGLLNELERGDDSSLDRSKIKTYVEEIDCMRRNGHFDFDLVPCFGVLFRDRVARVRASKVKDKSKGEGMKESNLIQYLCVMFQDNVIRVKARKVKDNSKGEETKELNLTPKTNADEKVIAYGIEEPELMFNRNTGKLQEVEKDKIKAIRMISRQDSEMTNDRNYYRSRYSRRGNDNMLSYGEELNNLNRSFRFMTRQECFARRVFKHNYERRSIQSDIGHNIHRDMKKADTMDFFTAESEASSILEESLEISDKTYNPLDRSKTSNLIDGPRIKYEDQSVKSTEQPKKMPSSTTISVDEEFSKYMEEATILLKQARECMSQADEETADYILYKSAKLLSAAEAMRPMSLIAVGQLGNTYLLHGELKLKISREMRTLLSRSDASLSGNGRCVRFKKLTTRKLNRGDVESALSEVCEECEELLVGAGRKYRTALSIDGNDVRSLYNWGLALSFRAQLIADIGPEAALDADKIFLAAIDKFDAMMSRSNLYATDALYGWGIVLQQRAYLRPGNNRERMKLLHQAKSLFEDVLSTESNNVQVREALVSCLSELDYSGQS